jgi:transcriptional regulator with XRE-family HTH domain
MIVQELGMRIRRQREKRGLTQNDVAHALQLSPQAVSKWERGENAPDIALLVPLAKLLGVSIDWLMGRYVEDLDVFQVTVLASGVQAGRQRAEEMAAKDFAVWVNAHCYVATEAVLRHDGVPIKYIGPGILSFFSGANHEERAIRAALHAVEIAADALKIGIGSGEVFLGSIGHSDYARPDIIGDVVGVVLCAKDWAAAHTAGGIAVMASTLAATSQEFRRSVEIGKETRARFPRVKHAVPLAEVRPRRSGGQTVLRDPPGKGERE